MKKRKEVASMLAGYFSKFKNWKLCVCWLNTDKECYECKTVILANGGSARMLGIPGESLKGIRLNAPKDGLDYKGKNIYIIGGADGAVKEAFTWLELQER